MAHPSHASLALALSTNSTMLKLFFCIIALLFSLSVAQDSDLFLKRKLKRFTRGEKLNEECWERGRYNGNDGFFTVIDVHNHFIPFGGPEVPFDTYFEWMKV